MLYCSVDLCVVEHQSNIGIQFSHSSDLMKSNAANQKAAIC